MRIASSTLLALTAILSALPSTLASVRYRLSVSPGNGCMTATINDDGVNHGANTIDSTSCNGSQGSYYWYFGGLYNGYKLEVDMTGAFNYGRWVWTYTTDHGVFSWYSDSVVGGPPYVSSGTAL